MTNTDKTVSAAANTDREIWRAMGGDASAPSIHVTQGGSIGINVGGKVHVMSVEKWHQLASRTQEPAEWQVERVCTELHRLSLVIESCVRHSEGRDHPNYIAVVDLLRSVRPPMEQSSASKTDAMQSLELARDLISEAKGVEGPQGGTVTDHLDAAEHWLNQVEKALRAASITPPAPERSKEEVGVRIKPLEWNENGDAKTALATYHVEKGMFGWQWSCFSGAGGFAGAKPFATETEAKAAAQADYEQRIRSALEPSPIHKGEDDGSDAAAIEIADAVIAWMVKYDLLDADLEYRDDDIIAVLDDLAPEASPHPVTISPEEGVRVTDEMMGRIIEAINEELIDADVDYPAGREAGHRIEFDEASMASAIRAALSVKPGEQG